MKIAILSRNEKLYSTERLVEAAHLKGHSVEVIDYLRCCLVLGGFLLDKPGHARANCLGFSQENLCDYFATKWVKISE